MENIIWSGEARGVVRCGVSNIKMVNITIPLLQPGDCLSTPGGGPQVLSLSLPPPPSLSVFSLQLGQPGDDDIYNVSVENLSATNTGDDSVAFFNVRSGGSISNCTIR